MSKAGNKERNEFFLRDLYCMNNSSLAFLADKVGMWECFFFCAKPLLQKIAARSLFQSSPFLSRIGCFFLSSFTAAGDKSRQLLRLLLLSYEETHGMLGLLHVLLLPMYSCIKCSTLILLGLVSYPAFFDLT